MLIRCGTASRGEVTAASCTHLGGASCTAAPTTVPPVPLRPASCAVESTTWSAELPAPWPGAGVVGDAEDVAGAGVDGSSLSPIWMVLPQAVRLATPHTARTVATVARRLTAPEDSRPLRNEVMRNIRDSDHRRFNAAVVPSRIRPG